MTIQFGAKWAEFLTFLEVRHGLDINNRAHIWLLHFLLLADINADATIFAESWNEHKIQMKRQASRSPKDMWLFDMITNGVRGEQLSPEEIDRYGIDWELVRTQTSTGDAAVRPETLGGVDLESPDVPMSLEAIDTLRAYIDPFVHSADVNTLSLRWIHALAFVRSESNVF